MKTIAILCSLFVGLFGLANANNDLVAKHGKKHTLELIVSLTFEDDRGNFHKLDHCEMANLKVKCADAHTEVVQISPGKEHKLEDGQCLVTVNVYTDEHDGKLALTVSHQGFETQTLAWSLRADGRPAFDLVQEPSN